MDKAALKSVETFMDIVTDAGPDPENLLTFFWQTDGEDKETWLAIIGACHGVATDSTAAGEHELAQLFTYAWEQAKARHHYG
ncbi:MAG: hypothetical protein AB2669_03425 [Candidatus Thiodiazotropha endolucinida]